MRKMFSTMVMAVNNHKTYPMPKTIQMNASTSTSFMMLFKVIP